MLYILWIVSITVLKADYPNHNILFGENWLLYLLFRNADFQILFKRFQLIKALFCGRSQYVLPTPMIRYNKQ